MSDLQTAAVGYASYGWHVVPLHTVRDGVCSCEAGADCGRNAGKHPRIRWAGMPKPEAAQVQAWWDRWPEANVGILTGSASGIVAIDVDDPAGLAELPELPATARIKTGNGEHLLYQAPAETLGNSVKKLASGIDVRAEGGLIVAPPSQHYSGARYEWVDKTKPVPLPVWVPERLAQPIEPEPAEEPSGMTPYGRSVLNGEIADVLQAKEGGRNDTLFQAAVRIFELVKADHIDKATARDSLVRAGTGCGLKDFEVRKTLESAWERAESRPPAELEDSEHGHPLPPRNRFLTIEGLRNVPPPKWLVPQVLMEGFTVLYGRRGSGKSFVALDIALTLASFGKTVVYCAGEGASGTSSRVDAWAAAHPQLDPGDRMLVLAHGAFPRLSKEQSVYELTQDFQYLEGEGRVPDLLIVDTWRRALAGESVSSDEAVGTAIDALDTIRDRWGTSALVIHHPRRPSRDEPNPPEAGSGALLDDADMAWKVWTASEDHTGERRLYNEKVKDSEKQPPLCFTLQNSASSLVVAPSVSDLMESGQQW